LTPNLPSAARRVYNRYTQAERKKIETQNTSLIKKEKSSFKR